MVVRSANASQGNLVFSVAEGIGRRNLLHFNSFWILASVLRTGFLLDKASISVSLKLWG
jgi:hypothetical protein